MRHRGLDVRLLIASHKATHTDPGSASGYATAGGFSTQTAALADLGDECVLCVPVVGAGPPGLTPIASTIEVHPLRNPAPGWRRRLAIPSWTAQLWREARAADIVHVPVPGDVGFLAVLVTVAARRPLFVRHCGTWRQPASRADRALKWVLERLADRGVLVFATGADTTDPTPGRAVRWIFSSSISENDLDEVRASARRTSAAAAPPVLVTGGRLIASKGTDTAIEAFAELRRRGSAVHLHVVGDGPARPQLEALAARSGVADAVTFHGLLSRDEVLEVFDRSDVLVYPTRSNEGFPKIVLEALSRGLPVVATAVSAIPTMVDDAGTIVEPDVASVVTGLEGLVADEDLAVLRARAIERAGHYTLEAWVEDFRRGIERAWGLDLHRKEAA